MNTKRTKSAPAVKAPRKQNIKINKDMKQIMEELINDIESPPDTEINELTPQDLSPKETDKKTELKNTRIKRLKEYVDAKNARNRKIGKWLQKLVLDNKRDFKLDKLATTKAGAKKIIAAYNKRFGDKPERKMHKHIGDFNNDKIEDIVIHRGIKNKVFENCTATPIYVNGWTTKKSNYPLIKAFYDAYPDPKERKKHSFKAFVMDIAEKGGKMTRNDKDYRKSGYKTANKLTPYLFFVKRVFSPIAKEFCTNNNLVYDVRIFGKIGAIMYDLYVKSGSRTTADKVKNVTDIYESIFKNNIPEERDTFLYNIEQYYKKVTNQA